MLWDFDVVIPFPSVCWVRLIDVNDEKISYISKIANNFFKVVLETDEERRSATASEVKNQRSIFTFKVKQPFQGMSIRRNQLAVRGRQA